ncbi:MAG: GNAT family N-acetyltransferase [Candidatus Bacteroides intestinipullorum]|uniref:GNAT family N-acetyltransferase n=1 Tax=Candidatus Bacteroides intestinipullorum TaxID=2838471 RepID=A0A9E2KHZ5_9BACE|nr:GNAT family N-acetyltransferase [Candidatus Bacteroides intestinipullorum]
MAKHYLHGDQVYLRALEPEDLDFIYEVENHPDHWAMTDFTVPYSRFSIRQYLRDNQNDLFADKQLRLVIALKGEGTPIGIVDLFNYQPLHAHAEVGILVRREYRGRGYAGEALGLLCDYAFGFLALHQLVAYVLADNHDSRELFCANKFVSRGTLREWWRMGGEFKDVVVYQRLRDWDKAKGRSHPLWI